MVTSTCDSTFSVLLNIALCMCVALLRAVAWSVHSPCAHRAYFWVLFITQIQNA